MIFFLICFFFVRPLVGREVGRSVGFAFPGNECVKKKESPWQQRREIMEYWVEGNGGGAREEV